MCVIEELEPRVLLSAVPTASPLFLLNTPAGSSQPALTTGPTGNSPSNILHAYGYNNIWFGSVFGDGTGQTIAIVDAFHAPSLLSDVAIFDSQFSLPTINLTVIAQDGSSNLPQPDTLHQGDSWAVETSLDVEWIHAMAPQAKIVLVEANSDADGDLFASVDRARQYANVSVISMSWGGPEASNDQALYDQYLQTYPGHVNTTFIASSGDSGAYNPLTGRKAVNYPAASPYVLGVGGTTLSVDATGNYISEVGWGNGTQSISLGGSGGGTSRYIGKPSYQNSVKTPSTNHRTVPDVASDADPASGVPVIDTWDFTLTAPTPWAQVGGTSLAGPLWAALIAITDQGRVLAGMKTLDGFTQTLPMIYTAPVGDFNDITQGNNGFAAAAGYDLVTGRGTPVANLIASTLVGTTWPVPTITSPSTGFIAGQGWTVTLTATATDASSTVTSVDFYDGAAKLGSGVLSGGTWTLAWDTSTAAFGTHIIVARATDAAGLSADSMPALTISLRIIGDANGDGVVDGLDYGFWQDGYGKSSPTFATGDFNGDGAVDGLDYGDWQNHYGDSVAAAAAAIAAPAAATAAGRPVVASAPVVAAPAPQAAAASPGFLQLVSREPRSTSTGDSAAIVPQDAADEAGDPSVLAMARAIVGAQGTADAQEVADSLATSVAAPPLADQSPLSDGWLPADASAADGSSVAGHSRLGSPLGAEGLNLLDLRPLDVLLT
jgi:hypothetical protein